MKKVFFTLIISAAISISANAQLKGFITKAKEKVSTVSGTNNLSNAQIGKGLKEALQKGVSKQVTKLTATDGFYKNEMVKIVLPQELQKVDKTLRKMGMDNLADKGILVLNRAAEDAVKEATPIFTKADNRYEF